MGKNISRYVTNLVDILNAGVTIITPKAGFLEDLFDGASYKAKARLIKMKVTDKFYDFIEASSTMRELDEALEAAKDAEKEISDAKSKSEKEIAEAKTKADAELLDRQNEFNKTMKTLQDEFEFEKAQALARLEREEKIIKGGLDFDNLSAQKNIEYTNALIEQEKQIFNAEVERLTAQFQKDSASAQESLKKELDGKLSIANAEIDRLKAEAVIAYGYDIGVVEKKVYAEVHEKLTALQTALSEAGLKDELIERLNAEVEYFRSRFEDERTTTNVFGAKALDSALKVSEKSIDAFGSNLGREAKPVNVFVDKSIGKKSKD